LRQDRNKLNSEPAEAPNGWRKPRMLSAGYPLVGGTRQRRFNGTSFKPGKQPENAQTPTSRVHAVLGGFCLKRILNNSVNHIS